MNHKLVALKEYTLDELTTMGYEQTWDGVLGVYFSNDKELFEPFYKIDDDTYRYKGNMSD